MGHSILPIFKLAKEINDRLGKIHIFEERNVLKSR